MTEKQAADQGNKGKRQLIKNDTHANFRVHKELTGGMGGKKRRQTVIYL